MNIEEFTAQFIEFAKANGITAEPVDTPHVDNQSQHYITWTHEDGRIHEVALNLAFTGGPGQKDIEVRGLRKMYGLPEALPINWDKFTGVTKPFEHRGKGGAPPNPPDSPKRVGNELRPGFFQDLGTGAAPGQIHEQDGVKYRYIRTSPLSGEWALHKEDHVA